MSLPSEQHTAVLDPVVPTSWLMGMVETWLPWTILAVLMIACLLFSERRR
jgi:hypothetical protein